MRYMYGLLFFALVLFVPGAQPSLADVGGASPGAIPAKYGQMTPEERALVRVSSNIVDFCNKNIVKYRNALAVLKTPVVVPEPPAMTPGCVQCGKTGQTENEQRFAEWYKKAEQPESDATRDLLSIMRVMTLFGYDPNTSVGGIDNNALSPLAKSCLKQFDFSTMQSAVGKLIDRQYNKKAYPMVQKYKKDVSRAPAGIRFALIAARQYALWNGGQAAADDMLAEVGAWIHKAIDDVEANVFQKHQYYWCPSYWIVLREDALASGGESHTNVEDAQKLAKRMLDFMHFKVKLDAWLVSNTDSNHTRVHWTGQSELSFDIDYAKGCYTPKFTSWNVTVEDWLMKSDKGQLDLVGPHVFESPISGVDFNLCDQQPKMRIVFSSWGPLSNVDCHCPAPVPALDVFGGTMSALTVNDKKQSGELQKDAGSAKSDLESLKAQVTAHSNDRAWLMSPEGQAVIQKIQAIAMGNAGGAGANTGTTVSVVNAVRELSLPWTNGTPNVVDKQFEITRSDGHLTAHITIVNDPQNGSDIGSGN